MSDFIKRVFELIGKRVFVFYLIVLTVSLWTIPYNKVLSYARPTTLSRVMPSFHHMAKCERYGQKYFSLELRRTAFYLENLLNYFDNRADAYGMLGYVYSKQGKDGKAVKNFEIALELNPHFFWFYHNLALDAYKKDDHLKVMKLVEDAAGSTDIDSNESFIFLSKVYRPVLRYIPDIEEFVKSNLKDGYRDAYTLMVLSSYKMKDYPKLFGFSLQAVNASFGRRDFFYYYAGVASYELGNVKQATEYFQKSLQIDENNADTLEYIAKCWRKVKQENFASLAQKRAEFLIGSGQASTFDEVQMVKEMDYKIF